MSYQQTNLDEPPPYKGNSQTTGGGGGTGDSYGNGNGPAEQEIQKKHGWRDPVWAFLFWAHLIALLVTGFICYRKWKGEFGSTGDNTKEDQSDNLGPLRHAIPLIGILVAIGAGIAFIWLYLAKNFGTTLIWMSLIFSLIMSALVVVIALIAGDIIGVILCGLMFLFTCWYIYSVRHKIPFAAAMLDVSLRSMGEFKSAWSLPLIGMGLMATLAYLWTICSMSIVYAVDHGSNESARSVRGLIFFVLVLSFFWTMLTIKGWVHTCIAGVQATWYFLAPHAVPHNPVLGAVKRASTTSFGSICFGTFLVALIRTIRYFIQIAQAQARNSRNTLAACALCLLDCLVGCLESLVNYINQYAFAICAIYGTPFIESAKRAWNLMRSRGYDAVVNDSLLGGLFNFSIIIGGLVCGVIGGLLAYYAFDTAWQPWAGAGFVIGMIMLMVVTEVAESAVIALFICLADDPAALQRSKPEAYTRLMDPLAVHYPNRMQQQGQMV